MLQVVNLGKSYGEEVLFKDASFVLGQGERLGLIGRNGSGKTTLFKILLGLESPGEGSISIPKNYRIGYLQQHISFSEDTLLEEAALALSPEEEGMVYKAEKILSGLGFSEADFERSPSVFSGGYQLRIHLAKVLIEEPDLLLLDEPTNYLDVVSIRWLERTLSRWQGELVVISHDREFIDKISTHTMAIHRHRVQKIKGNTEKLYEMIGQQETLHEKSIVNETRKQAEMKAFITRFRSKASKAKAAQSKIKALEKRPLLSHLNSIDTLGFKFSYAAYYGQNILKAENLTFGYEGKDDLIKDFSIEIEQNDRIAIIGKNGRGKTTLLNLIAGEFAPRKGEVVTYQRTKIGYFGQLYIQRLNLEHTVEEEISAGDPSLRYGEVRKICGLMMFGNNKAKKKIGVLSGGERSRVVLGKILAAPANILLLDEPTHHLDMESIEALIASINEFQGAVVIVTHDESMLRAVANKLIICHEDRQETFSGDYDDFLSKIGWGEEKKVKIKKRKK
jgi:ATP-binding cassette, subfamily F, member 3